MKINRFFAMAVIALLVVGAMGVISYRALAQGTHNPVTQSQDCSQDEADDTEVQSSDAADTDTVELQCGDQNEADSKETIGAADGDTDQVEEQVGSQNDAETEDSSIGEADTDTDQVEEQVGDQNAADNGVEAKENDQD